MRDTGLGGSDRRMGRLEVCGVVFGPEEGRQVGKELLGPSPRLAVRGGRIDPDDRALTGPLACRLVRQMAPSPSIWKHRVAGAAPEQGPECAPGSPDREDNRSFHVKH